MDINRSVFVIYFKQLRGDTGEKQK